MPLKDFAAQPCVSRVSKVSAWPWAGSVPISVCWPSSAAWKSFTGKRAWLRKERVTGAPSRRTEASGGSAGTGHGGDAASSAGASAGSVSQSSFQSSQHVPACSHSGTHSQREPSSKTTLRTSRPRARCRRGAAPPPSPPPPPPPPNMPPPPPPPPLSAAAP
eukprot:scaffold64380_cov60-Phaeocystis_antarctica.AAC.9